MVKVDNLIDLAEIRRHIRRTTHHCSFCGKTNYETRAMVTSCSAYICNECVIESAKIMGLKLPGK